MHQITRLFYGTLCLLYQSADKRLLIACTYFELFGNVKVASDEPNHELGGECSKSFHGKLPLEYSVGSLQTIFWLIYSRVSELPKLNKSFLASPFRGSLRAVEEFGANYDF